MPAHAARDHLRRLGGQSGYGGGFVEHYIVGLTYPSGLRREIPAGLAFLVLVINIVIYTLVVRRWRTERPRNGSGSI